MSEDGMSWRTLSVRKILRVQEAEMSTLLLVEVVEKEEATLQGAGDGVVHPAQGGEGGANLPQVEMEK